MIQISNILWSYKHMADLLLQTNTDYPAASAATTRCLPAMATSFFNPTTEAVQVMEMISCGIWSADITGNRIWM